MWDPWRIPLNVCGNCMFLLDTVPEDRVFSVHLENFLHDVKLINVTFSTGVLTVAECNARGFTIREYSFPNRTKHFSLEVPFDADVVVKHVGDKDAEFPFLQLFCCLWHDSGFYFIRILNSWLPSTPSLWSLGLSSCLKKLHSAIQLICRHLCRMLVSILITVSCL